MNLAKIDATVSEAVRISGVPLTPTKKLWSVVETLYGVLLVSAYDMECDLTASQYATRFCSLYAVSNRMDAYV